jgi:hypothetical protein
MKLHVDHEFAAVTVERFLQVYFSEDFNNRVAAVSGLKSRVLVDEKIHADGSRDRRVRMHPAVTVPSALQKFVTADQIHYDEVSRFDAATTVITYRIDSKANDRVDVGGTIRIVPHGGGVRRIIDGHVEVKAPFGVGAMVEKFIEAEVQKGYANIRPFLQRYLDEHATKSAAASASTSTST